MNTLNETLCKLPKNWSGIEPWSVFKTVHSSRFLSKSLGRNARNSFNSFEIELSAPIFKKRYQENQKILWKSSILADFYDFHRKSHILSEIFGFSSVFFQKSEPTVRFQMTWKSFSRFSRVIWTKIDSCGQFWTSLEVRVRLEFYPKTLVFSPLCLTCSRGKTKGRSLRQHTNWVDVLHRRTVWVTLSSWR